MRTTLVALAALLVWAAPASAAAPIATTGRARDVTDTTATLTGRLDPRSQPTSYYFEYGKTKSYGGKTPNTSAGAGKAGVNVTAPLTGLKPVTTYHYRLVAFSPDGTDRGKDSTFKTASVPVTLTID